MSSSNANTPFKARASPGIQQQQQGPSPFRSSSADKFRSSLVPTSRPSPARLLSPATKLSKSSPSARDLFRSTKSNSQPGRDLFRTATPQPARTKTFSPDLPASVTRPTATMRKYAPHKSVSAGMANIGSTEPFAMRISSPDRGLTGEVIAKQIPHDPNRTDTVYADHFLAHKCPEGLDDHQRRQFFCVLDLRRLKYAADEIFAKKDWKLNIINFAKEYEKSRSMIMLRYGLYQFKNIKPSDEVLKKWRTDHGLPDTSSPAVGSTKRKAEHELSSKDNTLMDSTINQNKRRNLAQDSKHLALNGPAPFKKSKRKADETEEADENENQPSKMQKSTPSGATSRFESIINKTQSTSSPTKAPALSSSLFGTTKPTDSPAPPTSAAKANPFAPTSSSTLFSEKASTPKGPAASVLAGHKIGSTPASNGANIFSYLSESSPNDSGNENGNANDDEDSQSEPEHDSEEQGPSAAVSTGTSTPPIQTGSLFGTSGYKPDPAVKLFGGMTKPSEPAPKGGLFDRVSMGANGQPLRAVPDADEQPKQTPAKQPGDFTFNAQTTPISFSKPVAPTTTATDTLFGNKKRAMDDEATAPASKKPAAASSASPASTEPKQVTTQTDTKPNVTSIFDKAFLAQASSAKAPTLPKPTGTFFNKLSSPEPQPAGKSNSDAGLGASTTNSTSSGTGKNPPAALEFQSTVAPTTSSPSPFGTPAEPNLAPTASKSLFGEKKTDAPVTSTPSIFDTKSAATTSTPLTEKKPKESTKTATSIFGTTPAAAPATPTPSIFGERKNQAAKNPAPSIFGSTTPAAPSITSLFGEKEPAEPAKSATSIFGATSTTPAINGVFGGKNQDEPAKAAAAPSIFGATPTPAATGTLFGEKKAEPANASSMFSSNVPAGNGSIFGSQPATNGNTQSSSFTFGGSATPSPAVSFGAPNSQPNGTEPKKVDFQFGSSTPSANSTFTFGQDSAAAGSGFSFTAGGGGQQVNNPFAIAQSSSQVSAPTTTPSSSFNFSFGQQAPSTPTTVPSTQTSGLFSGFGTNNGAPSINFTQATPGQTKPSAAPSIFSGFQAGGSGLAGTSSPFPAPSSIGTTPANGTPEPQAPNEDGEEAPQEQISLTGGGPGEEDESLIHEVRAKAIQYIPVGKGGEGEENSKSPWSTRGVGPLRVLKNNATGSVRILLRAEPRGHVAMNKTILSDVEYKVKEKTVNFVAASDDGSGLETWVLQVKKPEFAKELAAVLEANKSANKK